MDRGPPFRIRVLLSTETEEQKKWGRPGNEASYIVSACAVDALTDITVSSSKSTVTDALVWVVAAATN